MKAVNYTRGWVDRIEPGIPFRMNRGVEVKDQISQKRLRELGKMLTVDEVRETMRLKENETVVDYIVLGDKARGGRKLKAYKRGRHWLIPEAYLLEFLEEPQSA